MEIEIVENCNCGNYEKLKLWNMELLDNGNYGKFKLWKIEIVEIEENGN